MNRSIRTVGLLAATGILLTACGSATAGQATHVSSAPSVVTQTETESSDSTATVTVTETVHPPATETHTEAPTRMPTSSQQSRPDPDTTASDETSPPDATDAEIKATTAHASNVVNTYWVDLFASWHDDQGDPVHWWTPDRYNGDGFYDSARGHVADCHADYDNARNAFFCPDGSGSGFLAWDLVLFRQEAVFGDAAIYATVAHEFGHAAQARFRADRGGGASPLGYDTMRNELQADCLAGATLAKAEQDGYLTADPGRYATIVTALAELNEPGDHGTDTQRIAAYSLGYDGDIESCLYNKGVPPASELVG